MEDYVDIALGWIGLTMVKTKGQTPVFMYVLMAILIIWVMVAWCDVSRLAEPFQAILPESVLKSMQAKR